MQDISQKFIVEQHKDDIDKAHLYFYSPVKFVKKSPDTATGIEVKGSGDHGIAFCSPSIHKNENPDDKNEHRYEIIGTNEPFTLTIQQASEMIQHLNSICLKHGLEYLAKDSGLNKLKPMLKTLTIDKNVRIYEGERHITLLAAADSLLLTHLGNIRKEEQLKDFFMKMNDLLCEPESLLKQEINGIWNSAVDFVTKIKREKEQDDKKEGAASSLVEKASESIMSKHRLLTIEETREMWYYRDGVYVPGGEILIEKEAENMYRYDLANRYLSEIKGHIIRSTYRTHDEIDSDLNIINLKNGLYNIRTGEFTEHSPDYISINQVPVQYNPKAKPKLFGKFLHEVLYPSEIRTAIELIAYSFYRDNPFEIITILFGYGANGKSVFTGLLSALHGTKRISNVPLSSMLKDPFALSDLEDKSVNIDTELSTATIRDTSILKKLTGRQPTRIQRKNQRAYDVGLYAKLYFNANRIPSTYDDSDAFFRRKIILGFPNKFEGRKDDPDLIKKLTTEEELSCIFNVLMHALRNVLKNNGVFVKEKTIDQRRERYVVAADPIEAFLKDAVAEDSVELDVVTKEKFYQAYRCFCKEHKLAIQSKESLGKSLKNSHKFDDGRESSGERRTIWKGIKLTEKYNIELEQEILKV